MKERPIIFPLTTHAPGCWGWGPKHYECALREIELLTAEWKRITAAQGEANTRAEQLEEALRGLEERERRDEALLRQALEVLSRAHKTAMEQTLRARVPECSAFAGIAQDLDFVVAALRERLSEGAQRAGEGEQQ